MLPVVFAPLSHRLSLRKIEACAMYLQCLVRTNFYQLQLKLSALPCPAHSLPRTRTLASRFFIWHLTPPNESKTVTKDTSPQFYGVMGRTSKQATYVPVQSRHSSPPSITKGDASGPKCKRAVPQRQIMCNVCHYPRPHINLGRKSSARQTWVLTGRWVQNSLDGCL